MTGTQIVAVRKALVAALSPLDALADVDTKFQWQVKWSRRERIWTRNATFTHKPAAIKSGRNFRDEAGAFDLVLYVEGTKDAEVTASRAVELGTTCEEHIADHKNNNDDYWSDLGVSGLNWIQVEGNGSLTEMFGDGSTLAELSYPIAYSARLT